MSTRLPSFITFTGVDDRTSISGLVELSQQYPIEWGVLFSQKQQGAGRYPSMEFINELVDAPALRLSAHLCGICAREVIASGRSIHDALLADHFRRAQIKVHIPFVDTNLIKRWADGLHIVPIVQCREGFPVNADVAWLYDASRGAGETSGMWPLPPNQSLYGYAGGITHLNVANIVTLLGEFARSYWIEIEAGVRSVDQKDTTFNLDRCRQICESVYGPPGTHAAESALLARAI